MHKIRNMKSRFWVATLSFALAGSLASGQTRITPPSNKYNASQDVELGRKAASEARNQLPIMHDDAVTSYVAKRSASCRRHSRESPPPEFQYLRGGQCARNRRFALPGGPMFVNRGTIEAAASEGEVAGAWRTSQSRHSPPRHRAPPARRLVKVGQPWERSARHHQGGLGVSPGRSSTGRRSSSSGATEKQATSRARSHAGNTTRTKWRTGAKTIEKQVDPTVRSG